MFGWFNGWLVSPVLPRETRPDTWLIGCLLGWLAGCLLGWLLVPCLVGGSSAPRAGSASGFLVYWVVGWLRL